MWLGSCSRTDEAIIRALSGIVRAGMANWQTIEEARKTNNLLAVRATPSTGGNPNPRHNLVVGDNKDVDVVRPDQSEMPTGARRFRITKHDIEKIGYPDGCVGCSGMRADKADQRHSEHG